MPPAPHISKPRKRALQPAPGDLRLVQSFLNTFDLRAGTEAWENPAALAQWAVGEGLLPVGTELSEADLQRTIDVREGLRAALAGGRKKSHLQALDNATTEAVLRVRFEPGGAFRLEPVASGIDGFLGRLWVSIAAAQVEGVWQRFKVCASAECRAAFYDLAPNRSAKWCRPGCGDLLRLRALRKRRLYAGLRRR